MLSAGERHKDIALGSGIELRSIGKVCLEEYASQLAECSIGLSLMLSPHPSYPPLEMAKFGMDVITNKYSIISSSLFSVESLNPNEIASQMINSCERNRDRIEAEVNAAELCNPAGLDQLFTNEGEQEFGFIEKVAKAI